MVSVTPAPFDMDELIRYSLSQGASGAKGIAAADIIAEENLAKLCTTCPNHGFSPSCPPHVSGPPGFRKLQRELPWAVVIRQVVPLSALFSDERREVGRFLHELVATVESHSVQMGYGRSKAFAGGSCKDLFCHDHQECRRLAGGPCRHGKHARQSMSGYGINVSDLMEKCGWPSKLGANEKTGGESMSWLAGLVLIG